MRGRGDRSESADETFIFTFNSQVLQKKDTATSLTALELSSLAIFLFFKKTLYIQNNLLTDLDLNKNTAITYLDCHKNELTSLNFSENTALTFIDCHKNLLTSIDISKNLIAIIQVFMNLVKKLLLFKIL